MGEREFRAPMGQRSIKDRFWSKRVVFDESRRAVKDGPHGHMPSISRAGGAGGTLGIALGAPGRILGACLACLAALFWPWAALTFGRLVVVSYYTTTTLPPLILFY